MTPGGRPSTGTNFWYTPPPLAILRSEGAIPLVLVRNIGSWSLSAAEMDRVDLNLLSPARTDTARIISDFAVYVQTCAVVVCRGEVTRLFAEIRVALNVPQTRGVLRSVSQQKGVSARKEFAHSRSASGAPRPPCNEALSRKERRMYRPEMLLQPGDVASMVAQALTLPPTAEVTDISMRPMHKSH